MSATLIAASTRTRALGARLRRDSPPPGGARRRSWNIEVTPRRVPRAELMHFCRQLSVFIRSGMPITAGLELAATESRSRQLREIAADVAEQLRRGSSFSDAAAAHPRAFAPYQLGMLRSAEVTGRLDTVLDQIADYVERDAEARNRVLGALLYPGIVLVAALLTIVVMAVFVLPRFEVFFASFRARLPLPTRMLLALCAAFSHYWPEMVGIVCGSAGLLALCWSTDRGRTRLGQMISGLPIVGPLVSYVIAERMCRILAVMIESGVLLGDALAIAATTTSSALHRARLQRVRTAVLDGRGLSEPLAEAGVFRGPAEQLFRIGEATGTLDEQLARAASFYERELEYRLKRFTALFEPAVILLVGIVVGFVAIALISAIYGIYNQVQV